MKKTKSIIIALAVVFLTVSAVYAQTQNPGQDYASGQKKLIFKELNLTPEQQKRLEENRQAQRQEMEKLHTAMKEKQAKLQEALKDPAATIATVEPLANDMKSLQAQLIDHRVNAIFAVKEILTPQQFAKFGQMTQKRQGNRNWRLQNRRERKRSEETEK